ncbi:MAG TPA: FecR domain-containing protein [Polyangiaceae bacterium]
MNVLTDQLLQLGRELAVEQDRALAQDLSLGGVRARVSARTVRRRRRLPYAVLALVAALAAVALLVTLRARAPLSASLAGRALEVGEWVSASEPSASPILFSDGSQIALSQGARARLATLDAAGAHLVLEAGALDVRVTPNHGARYRLSLGPFAVDVTGTRFDVGFRPSDEVFTLTLHEGKVVVSGCMLGEGRTLFAGEKLSASCRTGRFEIEAAGARAEPSRAGSGEPQAALVPAPTPLPGPEPVNAPVASSGGALPESEATLPGQADWRSLARQSRFVDAYATLGATGFEAAVAKASSDELLLLGDTARFAGKPEGALTAYQALRSRAAGAATAKRAAFAIGRVHFDQRAAYAEAARWFRTYLAEQPGGPFAREAEGRLMESLSRSGDSVGARRAAERYLAKYPRGAHARVARQLLGS